MQFDDHDRLIANVLEGLKPKPRVGYCKWRIDVFGIFWVLCVYRTIQNLFGTGFRCIIKLSVSGTVDIGEIRELSEEGPKIFFKHFQWASVQAIQNQRGYRLFL